MSIGTLVMVIVDMPDGCDDTYVYGDIGVITKIEEHVTYETDYTVRGHNGDYVYGKDQIRELTDEECREALFAELMR